MLKIIIFNFILNLLCLHSRPVRNIRSTDNFNIVNAMEYLSKFGYDIPQFTDGKAPLLRQDRVEAAIMDFQEFAGIELTGVLDEETVELMKMPRCGVKDGQKLGNYQLHGSKWDKRSLSYGVSKYSQSANMSNTQIDSTVAAAFKMWEIHANISFTDVKEGGTPAAPRLVKGDIDIRFETGRHGDDEPFDGQGGTLAHAFFPKFGGDLHMDDSEPWTIDSPNGINALQTFTHEIGHSLGLEHSWNRSSVMAPFYQEYNPEFKLEQDDIDAIQALYGKKDIIDEDDDEDENPGDEEETPNYENPDDGEETPNDKDDDTDDEDDDSNDEEEEKNMAKQLQIFLRFGGFNPGKIDGEWGKMTTKALQRFLNSQAGAHLKVDGDFGRFTAKTLQRYLNNVWGAGLKVDGRFGPRTKKALMDFLLLNNADLDFIFNLPLK